MTPVGVIVGVGGVGGDKQRTHLRLDLLLDLCKSGRGANEHACGARGQETVQEASGNTIGRIVSYRPLEILEGEEGMSCGGDRARV